MRYLFIIVFFCRDSRLFSGLNTVRLSKSEEFWPTGLNANCLIQRFDSQGVRIIWLCFGPPRIGAQCEFGWMSWLPSALLLYRCRRAYNPMFRTRTMVCVVSRLIIYLKLNSEDQLLLWIEPNIRLRACTSMKKSSTKAIWDSQSFENISKRAGRVADLESETRLTVLRDLKA